MVFLHLVKIESVCEKTASVQVTHTDTLNLNKLIPLGLGGTRGCTYIVYITVQKTY